uniref:Uncharacterized protein n=1 Tax=Steinernema glaseri TaxID=37863 RepID=A0A1I7ZH85_9BILA
MIQDQEGLSKHLSPRHRADKYRKMPASFGFLNVSFFCLSALHTADKHIGDVNVCIDVFVNPISVLTPFHFPLKKTLCLPQDSPNQVSRRVVLRRLGSKALAATTSAAQQQIINNKFRGGSRWKEPLRRRAPSGCRRSMRAVEQQQHFRFRAVYSSNRRSFLGYRTPERVPCNPLIHLSYSGRALSGGHESIRRLRPFLPYNRVGTTEGFMRWEKSKIERILTALIVDMDCIRARMIMYHLYATQKCLIEPETSLNDAVPSSLSGVLDSVKSLYSPLQGIDCFCRWPILDKTTG